MEYPYLLQVQLLEYAKAEVPSLKTVPVSSVSTNRSSHVDHPQEFDGLDNSTLNDGTRSERAQLN